MIPHVYVNAQCGSFAKYGLMGSKKDSVLQALVFCSDNGDQRGMIVKISADFSSHFLMRDVVGVPVEVSVDVPPATIRIYRHNNLLGELYGWTP